MRQSQVLNAVNRKIARHRKQLVPQDMQKILDRLQVRDIVAIDGCEVQLREGCRGKFPCKAAGRNKKSDEAPAAPGVKIIASFSVTGLCMNEMEITEGVADERQHTFTEKHRGDCLIGDRGYVDEKLEQRLEEGGVMFIIKGRKNMVSGTIVEAYGEDGQALKEYIGKKYGDIKERSDKWLDVIVACKDGRKVRIVREVNPNPVSTRRASEGSGNNANDGAERYVYLRTNIGRDKLNPEQLFQCYRYRWLVEHFLSVCSRGNGLQTINSADKNVVMSYMLFNIISALIKCYLMVVAMVRHKRNFNDISMLKVHIKPNVVDKFLKALGRLQKSQLYQILQEVAELIIKYCFRSHVSIRDQARTKSYPMITSSIRGMIPENA